MSVRGAALCASLLPLCLRHRVHSAPVMGARRRYGYYPTENEVVDAAKKAMFTHRESTAHQ
eukprot:COSAG01_NODE_1418_length_10375_cov_38.842254_1_plen_60_part_10